MVVRAAMDLFLEVCDLSPAERAKALDERCDNNPLLRAAVERMLAEDSPGEGHTGSMLQTGAGVKAAFDAAARRGPSRLERPPVLQGRYRIIRTIGEGGMGTVYEAEQVTPRRLVALKALRVGSADADDALRRFTLEAEVLARLQHPCIAHIHEAGFGDEIGEGPAWIAMELVRGKPLVTAANERSLDRVARLKLFLLVCDAVSFAHRRGVIHRDLKPSNILLAEPDADATGDAALGRPKVLDFGVARVLGDAWDAATVLTSPGQLVGTLSYMSPEQVSGDPDLVDVRTDVYALGVILYELLTGKRPYDVRGKGLAEAITTLREADPPLLSAVDPTLRGDLDAIAKQALAKEPKRRYQSVADFAADIERHLRGEPVAARADATLYVLARQAKRHRWPLTLVGVVLLAIVVFAIRSLFEAQRLAVLAKQASEATARAESVGRSLAAELDASQLEQARLLARGGSVSSAEEILRRRTGDSIEGGIDVPLLWAAREIAARHPRMVDWKAHDGDVYSVNVVPLMDCVVACGSDMCVSLSDFDGKVLRQAELGSHGTWVAVDETSEHAYVSTLEHGVLVFALPSLELVDRLSSDGKRVREVSVFGDQVVYSTDVPDLRIVNRSTGAVRTVPTRVISTRVQFIDETHLLVGRADGLVVTAALDLPAGTEPIQFLGRHIGGGVSAMSIDRASMRAYTSGDDRLIRTWDLRSRTELPALDGMNGTPRDVEFDPSDGTVLLSGWWTIDRWDPAIRVRRRIGTHPSGNACTRFWIDRKIAVTGHPGGLLRLWAIDNNFGGVPGPTMDGRSACLFAPDNDRLAIADGNGVTRIIDARTGETLVRPPQHLDRVKGLAFSRDGKYFASAGDDGRLWLSDATTGAPIALFLGADPTSSLSVAFSPDGRRLAVSCRDRSAKILEVPSLAPLATLQHSTLWQMISVAWAPDGQRLVTSARDKMLKVWSVEGQQLMAVSGEPETPWSLEFSPDGSMLAVGSWGRYVELRDGTTLELKQRLQGASALITRAGWVPTRPGMTPLIYASAADGGIRVWETAGGRVLFDLDPFPSNDVTGVSMSSDGRRLAATGAWGECVAWDLTTWDRWSARTLKVTPMRWSRVAAQTKPAP